MEKSRLDGLLEVKQKLLKEQKQLSDEASEVLAKLNDSNKQCRKNLLAAIAIARQPGYFEYYAPENEIETLENEKVINRYANKIASKQKEIDQIDREIEIASANNKKEEHIDPNISSISQWFDLYGHPTHETAKDMLTTFSPSPKIYGGTTHHRSFKTQASIMRKGHLTR